MWFGMVCTLIDNEYTSSQWLKCWSSQLQMSHLYASDFPFKNFCKLAQHAETMFGKKMFGKRVDQTTFRFVFPTISTSKKLFFSKHKLRKQHGMDSYRQWQISQSDGEITGSFNLIVVKLNLTP